MWNQFGEEFAMKAIPLVVHVPACCDIATGDQGDAGDRKEKQDVSQFRERGKLGIFI